MPQAWYSAISEELEDVEAHLAAIVRSDNAELDEMCNYVMTSGGKRIRPALCILAYYACGGEDPMGAIDVGSAFEIVHSATLVHDDINDKSEIRRGRRTLHREYSVSKAIVAGDYMMAKGFQSLGATSKDIVDAIVEAASQMSASEFIQKDFEHITAVGEDDYYGIIHGKTAMLINASAKSGAFLAGADASLSDAISDYAINVGMAFQITDDVLDVDGNLKSTGKRVGLDLIEGKPTLPTILAMQDPEAGPRIRELFSRREITQEDADEARGLIMATDALDACRRKASAFARLAVEALAPVPESEYKDALVALAGYVVDRDR